MAKDVVTGSEAQEVRHWIDQLGGHRDKRAHAAAELGRLGVWTRSSVRTRGSIATPATNRLPDPVGIETVIAALGDADPAVRCQVARTLGEWGGAEAAAALAALLRSEVDANVRLYAVHALRTIGGPDAVDALRRAVETGDAVECDAALSAIEELATGGSLQDTEPPAFPARSAAGELPSPPAATRVPEKGAVRTRGAKKTRGVAPPAPSAAVEDPLAATLQRVRANDRTSAYLRVRAGDVLRLFRR